MTQLRDQLQASLSGAYALDRELGGGGMSRVFVAEETRLGRKVVVKVLNPELAASLSNERFEREIRLAASLQQANIVPVLAAGETQGLPYYTMPFVDGESLRARLARDGTPFPIGEVLGILKDVGRALAYAHQHGVVHRDIKPDNVLLSGGAAVVTDFGIAKAIAAARTNGGATLTQVGTSIGTPAYMAPEQAAGDDVDHRSDLYSLGCLAYELLTGRVPFHGRTPQRMLAAHMSETPARVEELRPDCPPALASLVSRCLEKDPAMRPQSAGEVVQEVDAVATTGASGAAASVLLMPRVSLVRALAIWAAVAVGVPIVAKAAIIAIGLPDWVFPGSIIVMALGLPVVLATHFVQHRARKVLTTTPTLTPGGTPTYGTMSSLAVKAGPHLTWRRATLGGAWATGAFAAAVAGFMMLRAMGIGPAGSLFATGAIREREPLLVAEFKINGPDTALGPVLSEAVRTQLLQSRAISIMPSSEIADMLRRMRRPERSKLDIDLAKEVAQRAGVRGIVAGDATPLAAGYVLTLRLLAGESGDELASVREVVDGPRELIAGVDAVTRKLRGRLGESLKSVRGSVPLDLVTTSSIEALRNYTDGAWAADGGDNAKAIRLLEEAVRLDSNFAMAYRKLGVAISNARGNPQRRDSMLTRAYTLRDRLDERERLLAEAMYFTYTVPDRARVIAAYEAILARWPTLEDAAVHNLALALASRREFARAESLYTMAVTRWPGAGLSASQLVSTQLHLGRIADARRTWETHLKNNPIGVRVLGAIKYAEGDIDSAAVIVARNRGHANPQFHVNALTDLAALAMLRGRYAERNRLLSEARAADRARGATVGLLADELDAVEMHLQLDRPDEALKLLDATLARRPLSSLPERQRPILGVAIAYARAGRADRARALLAMADATVGDSVQRRAQTAQRHRLDGWIAIAENRPLDAVRSFRAADRLPDGPAVPCQICADDKTGYAFDRAELPDSVIAAYEHFVLTPSSARLGPDAVALPRILKRLGELHEAKGHRQEALGYYLRFAELWKNADPELQPQVRQVRTKIGRLRDTEGRRR